MTGENVVINRTYKEVETGKQKLQLIPTLLFPTSHPASPFCDLLTRNSWVTTHHISLYRTFVLEKTHDETVNSVEITLDRLDGISRGGQREVGGKKSQVHAERQLKRRG